MFFLLASLLLTTPVPCGPDVTLNLSASPCVFTQGESRVTFGCEPVTGHFLCTWSNSHRILEVESGNTKRLFFLDAKGKLQPVREWNTRSAWRYDNASGELYMEHPVLTDCNQEPLRFSRLRYSGSDWQPVPSPESALAPTRLQAIRGVPREIRRRPWFKPLAPAVFNPEDPLSDDHAAPVQLCDHNAATSWIAQSGAGTRLFYSLPATLQKITTVVVHPGHGKDPDTFARHARLKTFTLRAGERQLTVEIPTDPLKVPGSVNVPWHVVLDPPWEAGCMEFTVNAVYPGEQPLAIAEITFYTELDFSGNPAALIVAGLEDGRFSETQASSVLPTFSNTQLLEAWKTAGVTAKKVLATEVARRPVDPFLPIQLEILSWAPPELVKELSSRLSSPGAHAGLDERVTPDTDPDYLALLLPFWLKSGPPDAARLLAILKKHPKTHAAVRDHTPALARQSLIDAWCPDILEAPFAFSHWTIKDAGLAARLGDCLAALPARKDLRWRLSFLQAAAFVPGPRLLNRIRRMSRADGRDSVKLQALITLLAFPDQGKLHAQLAQSARPDAQLVLLEHWPGETLDPALVKLAASPWPPVRNTALKRLSVACHPDFARLARPVLETPSDEFWYPLLESVKTCGYGELKPALLKVFGKKDLADEPFATLAQLFALKKETTAANRVKARLQKMFHPKVTRGELESRVTAGTWLLRALAAFSRKEDTEFFKKIAYLKLPEPFPDILAEILLERCPRPDLTPRKLRSHPVLRSFLMTCR